MNCRKCGTGLAEDSLFCDQCGQRAVATPVASAPLAEPPTVTWSPPPPPLGDTIRLPAPSATRSSAPRRVGCAIGLVSLVPVVLAVGIVALNEGLISAPRQPTAAALASGGAIAGPTSALGAATTLATRTAGTPTPRSAGRAGTPTAAARPIGASSPVPTTPTRAAIPTQTRPAATARPGIGAPTVAIGLPGIARVLGKTGITVEGPAGWTYSEDLESPQEGIFSLHAEKSERSNGFLTSSGVFAIATWLMPEATEYAPDDLLQGFVDAQVTEYALRFGGDPGVGDYTITGLEGSRFTGWEATFEISGSGGTFLYGWADLRSSGRFVEVVCQGTSARRGATSAACRDAYATIDLED